MLRDLLLMQTSVASGTTSSSCPESVKVCSEPIRSFVLAYKDCSTRPAAYLFAFYLLGSLVFPISVFDDWVAQPNGYLRVLGNALPYGSWFNRATLLGPAVLILAVLLAWRERPSAIFHWLDWPMVLWILTPVLTGVANDSSLALDVLQSLYLALVWGAPYAAIRLAYRSHHDLVAILQVIVGYGIVTFVMALMEFVLGRFWYVSLYGYHPFQREGIERYFGYRPLLLLEDPNQIAMWWATVAIASLTLLRAGTRQAIPRWCSVLLALPPFLFQAAGASLLTLFGVALLAVPNRRVSGAALLCLSFMAMCGLVLHGPILRYGRQFTQSSLIGQFAKGILRDSSIGSFGWRLGLEEKNQNRLSQRPVFGWGDANFWYVDTSSIRPWGLATLVRGAFGVVGCCLWGAITVVPCACVLTQCEKKGSTASRALRALAIIPLVHGIDASMNSAYFLPTVMCLGMVNSSLSCASSSGQSRQNVP